MKTDRNLLRQHSGHRPLAALLCALVCAAAASSCLAAKNSPPTAQNLSVMAAANLSTPIVLQGSDPNGDPLTFSIVTPPTQGTLSGTAPNLTYTPSPDFLGPDTFTYRVSDGKVTSNPATVSIVVKVGLSINDISIIEGTGSNTAATFTVTLSANPGLLGVSFRYRTIDGTALGSGVVTSADYVAVTGSPVILTAGAFTTITVSVVADTRVEADETFFVELFEPSNNAVILDGTGRCTILNDDRLNQPPTAFDLSVAAAANRSTPFALQGSDPDGDSLSFSIISPPTHGGLSGTGPNLTYTTFGPNYLGPDSFTYVVSDGQAISSPATVSIAVKVGLEINNISVIEGASGTTAAIFTVILTTKPDAQGVNFSYRTIDGTAVANDADYLATSQTVLNAKPQTPITVSVLGDTRIEPDETFFVELFEPSDNAVIVNGTGRCTILNDDPTPVAFDLSVVAAANRSTPIVLQGSDPQGLPLTFNILSGPSEGTLNALGSPSSGTSPNQFYTPSENYLGPDSFTYVVSNGMFASPPATVSINVKRGLEINNSSITEGNSGTRMATFTVSLTVPASELDLVVFEFQTADGTAKAGVDYVATSGTASLATATQVTVPVIGDTVGEFNETFLMQLADATPNAVIVNGTGRCTIVNDDSTTVTRVGTAALDPEESVVQVGEAVDLRLTWTHPVGWRKLDSVDLLLVDDQGEVLAVRWHETENAFSLFNPAADRFVRTDAAESSRRFETSAVTLDLEQSTGGGPPGQTVTIDFSLNFKPHAAARTFSVEAFATDDASNQQGFESVGTITVLPRSHDQ